MKYLILIFCFILLSCGCLDTTNKVIRAGVKIKTEGSSMPPLVKQQMEQVNKQFGKQMNAVKKEWEYLTEGNEMYLDSNTISKLVKGKK